jgi:hypothetical protein
MEGSSDLLLMLHSLLRWLVLITVAVAGLVALRGYLAKAPIIVWERSLSIIAMVVCHVQLLFGLILYAMRMKSYVTVSNRGGQTSLSDSIVRYWKYEHSAMMILVIALVTIGRVLSKRAKTEPGKQLRVAIFYLLALALMLYAIPWPGTMMGQGRGWL